MNQSRAVGVVAAILAAGLLLAGCSSSSVKNADSSSKPTEKSHSSDIQISPSSWKAQPVTAATGAATSPVSQFVTALSYTDPQGYKFANSYVLSGLTAKSSVADSVPGKSVTTLSWKLSVTGKNLSDDRNAPWAAPVLYPFYTSDDLCNAKLPHVVTMNGSSHLACVAPGEPLSVTNTKTGATLTGVDVSPWVKLAPSATGSVLFDFTSEIEVDETKAAAITSALESPTGFVAVSRNDADNPQMNYDAKCSASSPILWTSTSVPGCNNLIEPVATSAQGSTFDDALAAALKQPAGAASCPFGKPSDYGVGSAPGDTFAGTRTGPALQCSSGTDSTYFVVESLNGKSATAFFKNYKTSAPVSLGGGHALVISDKGSEYRGAWYDDNYAIFSASDDDGFGIPDLAASWWASIVPVMVGQ